MVSIVHIAAMLTVICVSGRSTMLFADDHGLMSFFHYYQYQYAGVDLRSAHPLATKATQAAGRA